MNQYRVLARKYRPKLLSELIGQDVLVRTITNSIDSGRIAHAFLLTGIRGVGKTTSARIIARSLNCETGVTVNPCGVCEQCISISEDRNLDVLEMDAASRTGVGDIRELIDNVQYLPVAARYKVYIIDEVHMLSTQAFNALLKTLEEPPAHVKFVFATTELRKIPITILSRCQKFDLKRVETAVLSNHLQNICNKENIETDETSLALISRASEGSVRDSLSLLDQAIAICGDSLNPEQVREMLGIADKTRIYSLITEILAGKADSALSLYSKYINDGFEVAALISELMDAINFVSRIKILPSLADDVTLPESERREAKQLADKIGMGELSRIYQAMLKGYSEIKNSPSSVGAGEMIIIRLCYMAGLPSPAELVRKAQSGESEYSQSATPQAAQQRPSSDMSGSGLLASIESIMSQSSSRTQSHTDSNFETSASLNALGQNQLAKQDLSVSSNSAELVLNDNEPKDFSEMVELFSLNNEPLLYNLLKSEVRPVNYELGKVEVSVSSNLPDDFIGNITKKLNSWTKQRWVFIISSKESQNKTIAEIEAEIINQRKSEVMQITLVKKTLEKFAGAVVEEITILD